MICASASLGIGLDLLCKMSYCVQSKSAAGIIYLPCRIQFWALVWAGLTDGTNRWIRRIHGMNGLHTTYSSMAGLEKKDSAIGKWKTKFSKKTINRIWHRHRQYLVWSSSSYVGRYNSHSHSRTLHGYRPQRHAKASIKSDPYIRQEP